MDQDNATDRRKSQNRQAQRNFRDKRAQKVDHLQESLRDLTARFEQAQQDWANKQHGYQERINNLQNDLRVSNDKAAHSNASSTKQTQLARLPNVRWRNSASYTLVT